LDLNLKAGEIEKTVHTEKDGDFYRISVDENEYTINWVSLDSGSYILTIDNKQIPVYMVQDGDKSYINIAGENHLIEHVTSVKKSSMEGIDATLDEDLDVINAPMPGKIVKILVNEGDEVKKGKNAIILEAMKMETHVASPKDGSIKKILFSVGDQVNLGDTLIELDIEE